MRTLAVLALLPLLPCCLSLGSDDPLEVTQYHLNIRSDVWEGERFDLTLALRPFHAAESLSGDGIRYRVSDVEGGYWSKHEWAESVDNMVRRAVERDLEQSGMFRKVLLLETSGFADVVLDGEIHLFEEEDRGEDWYGVVETSFEAARRVDGEVLLHRRYHVAEKSADKTVAGVVRALSVALERVLDELKADLAERLAKEE
jgi:ABC-type uncharacterized transport system auxiliary subunit